MNKLAIDHAKVFAAFRRVFHCKTYRKISDLTGFDSGQVSRMRNGKTPISSSFMLKACIAADMSPVQMCHEIGLPLEYFFDC